METGSLDKQKPNNEQLNIFQSYFCYFSGDIISRISRPVAPLDTTAAPATLPNSQQDQTCQDLFKNDSFKTQNPRLSTTSSGAGESDQELQLNQLVVAQVHHDPILEMPSVEDKETGKISIEHIFLRHLRS